MASLVLTTAPTGEPVSLDELKEHLRVTHSDDDAYIADLGKVARQYGERIQGRAYVTQTWTLWLGEFPLEKYIELWRPPLQSVTHVKYYDAADAATTFASANYVVDDVSEPPRIVLKDGVSWPSDTLRVAKGVEVEFVAGYTNIGDELVSALHFIKFMVNHWYVHRVPVSNATSEIPQTARELLDQGRYRMFV